MRQQATSPHTPIVPLKKFHGSSEAGYYGDYMVQTDAAIGRLVDALKAEGQFDNTLIILTSDNGPAPFMRTLIQKYDHNPSGPLRGLKRDHLEGGHRVPFVASWPDGGIKGGKVIDALISQTDIMATLAAVAGADLPKGEGEDSLNILPSLQKNESVRKEMVYQGIRGGLGMRIGGWVYLPKTGVTKEPEWYLKEMGLTPLGSDPLLYNLDEDLGQKNNLSKSQRERAESMGEALKKIINDDKRRRKK